MKPSFAINILHDFRLWIALFFIVRLDNLAQPEMIWRGCMTLSVARNFLERDFNIFYPEGSIEGCTRGCYFIGSEMPILNAVFAFFYAIFGYSEWIGRMVVLISASIGLWFLHRVFKKVLPETGALAGAVIFAVSVAFKYSRVHMPDVFSISLTLVGVFYGWEFLEKGGRLRLAAFFVFSSLGILSKMPSFCALLLLLIPLTINPLRENLPRKISLISAGAIAAICMAAWYFWWVPHLESIGFKLYFPFGLAEGWSEFKRLWPDAKHKITEAMLQADFSYFFASLGLIFLVFEREWRLKFTFCCYTALFFLFALKTGNIYPTHDYYSIPWLPAVSLVSGFAFGKIFRERSFALLAVLAIISFISIDKQKADFFITYHDQKFLRLESIADSVSRPGERFFTNEDLCPRMLYRVHRRGLSWPNHLFFEHPEWLFGEPGTRQFMLIEKSRLRDSIALPVVYEDVDFRVYLAER